MKRCFFRRQLYEEFSCFLGTCQRRNFSPGRDPREQRSSFVWLLDWSSHLQRLSTSGSRHLSIRFLRRTQMLNSSLCVSASLITVQLCAGACGDRAEARTLAVICAELDEEARQSSSREEQGANVGLSSPKCKPVRKNIQRSQRLSRFHASEQEQVHLAPTGCTLSPQTDSHHLLQDRQPVQLQRKAAENQGSLISGLFHVWNDWAELCWLQATLWTIPSSEWVQYYCSSLFQELWAVVQDGRWL